MFRFSLIWATHDISYATVYKRKGNKAKATEHYEKFLDIWKHANPGIAEVDDARERLAGLKNQ